MDSKIFENLKNKGIGESSLNLYLNNLKRLNDGNEIKNFNFLKDETKILERIKDYKKNTRRTYLISIVSLLKQEPKMKKIYDKYYTILMEYNKDMKTNNDKSETQKENWISQDEVKKIYSDLSEKVKPILEKKKITVDDYNLLLQHLILSLYTLQPPRRNLDFQNMLVVRNYNPEMDKAFNYLDLDNKKFHFNNYKTNKTYSTQTTDISDDLFNVIIKFLKFHPEFKQLKKKSCSFPFLVDANNIQFETKNSITRILNKIFDKKIGSSMLRNIYLTSKYSNNLNELQKDAKAMGTSASTIENQYIKLEKNEI